MSILTKFVVRSFEVTDRDYITKTVLFGHFSLSSCAKRNNRDSFFNGHNKVINALLDHAQCLVLADPEDKAIIYGFVIFEKSVGDFDILHYCHVRKDFRGLGLLKNLVEVIKSKPSLAISHINDDIRPARLKKYWEKVIVDNYVQNILERI